MNKILSVVLAVLAASVAACGGGDGAAPAGSGAPAASGKAASSAKPGSSGAADAKKDDAKKDEPPKSAAAFPAQDLSAPFDKLTIGAPTGAKIAKGPLGDDVTIDGPDYMVKVEVSKDADLSKLKGLFEKMGAKITVDQPDGIIAQAEEKGAPSFQIMKLVKIGDKTYQCSNTIKKAIATAEKAQEALDVCGSLKAK